MKQSQVRVIGANVAAQVLEKTLVLIDLVTLEQDLKILQHFQYLEGFGINRSS